MLKPIANKPVYQNSEQFFRTDHLKTDLKGRSIRGGAVTIAAQTSKFVLQMGSTVVLARLLSPSDYGLRLTQTQASRIMAEECCLEAELLYPVPETKMRLEAARARGDRIIFVSDMYLPSTFICQQLIDHALWQEGDRLYVSCEQGARKTTGQLFQQIIRAEGVTSQSIHHFGNNLSADFYGARRVGISATYVAAGNPNRYEQILEKYAQSTEGLAATMAGASRLARLNVPVTNQKEKAIRDVAAGAIAPLLVSYVLWILLRAKQQGLKRLYFLSREGQVLLQIACQLAHKLELECELRYLYASRQTFNRAVFDGKTQGEWLWINVTDATSVRDLLARIGLFPEQIKEHLIKIGLSEEKWSCSLTKSELNALKALLNEAEIRTLILQVAKEKKQILLQYLKQEGLFEDVAKGCIDIGWNGTLHNTLSILLDEAGGKPIRGFYFGLRQKQTNSSSWREAYLFDLGKQTGYTKISPKGWLPGDKMIMLIETFCAADHGSVSDFVVKGDLVQPVLRQGWHQVVTDWGLPIARKTIDAFTKFLLLKPDLIDSQADLRASVAELLTTFWHQPSQTEAKAWGSFPVEMGQGEEPYLSELANPYDWNYPARVILKGFSPLEQDHHWIEGSLLLTHPSIRSTINLSVRGREKLKRWKQIVNGILCHYSRTKKHALPH